MIDTKKKIQIYTISALTAIMIFAGLNGQKAKASCDFNSNNQGRVTMPLEIPSNGEYTIWSRIMITDPYLNSFKLSINNGSCLEVNGAPIATNQWTWVNYQSGSTNNVIAYKLNAGANNLELTSSNSGVKVDKIMAIANSGSTKGCIPSGSGDNCMLEADTQAPSVAILSPQNNASLAGSFDINIEANDNKSVAKVEVLINNSVYKTLYGLPYKLNFDSRVVNDGVHTIQAKAYDNSGNLNVSAPVSITVKNTATNKPPSVSLNKPELNYITPANIELVASAKDDDGAMQRVEFYANNKLIGQAAASPYRILWQNVETGNYSVYAKAIDDKDTPATSNSFSLSVNPQPTQPPAPEDTEAPTQPKLSRSLFFDNSRFSYGVSLGWQSSHDNIGVKKYIIKRDNKIIAETSSNSFKDLGVSANYRYTYSVEAQDSVGNTSQPGTTSIQAACFLIWCWEI